MKKGLVILMALAFIGGVAFAEDGMGPDITYGVSAYAGMKVFTNNTDMEPSATATDRATVSAPWIGGVKADSSDYSYYVAPWVKLVSGAFSANIAPVFYGAGTGTNDEALNRYELTLGLSGTGYGIYDRIRLENKEFAGTQTMSHRIKGDFSMDDLSAGVVFSGSTAAAGTLDDIVAPFVAGPVDLDDLQFTIKNLWGFTDVKVGGYSTSYYHTNNYRLQAIDWFASDDDNVASNNVADVGFRWIGTKKANYPVNTTFNIGNLVESVPLTIRTGVNVPITWTAGGETEWRDFLAGNNMIASAEFMMEGIGDFVLGAIPAFAYTYTAEAAGTYTTYTMPTASDIFLDANISAIDNLQLQASLDYAPVKMDSADPAATTGAGTAASPFTTAQVAATGLAFGVEFVYDLADVMEGLSVDGAIAVTSLSGLTALNSTGVAWTAPVAGPSVYIAPNFTEANFYGAAGNGEVPFIFGVGVSYDIDENNSVGIGDEFDSMAGDLSDVDGATGMTSYGWYNTNDIWLSYSVKAGGGKLSAGIGYTMYLGIPAASDYQITGAENIADYDQAIANGYKPLSAYVKYSAKF